MVKITNASRVYKCASNRSVDGTYCHLVIPASGWTSEKNFDSLWEERLGGRHNNVVHAKVEGSFIIQDKLRGLNGEIRNYIRWGGENPLQCAYVTDNSLVEEYQYITSTGGRIQTTEYTICRKTDTKAYYDYHCFGYYWDKKGVTPFDIFRPMYGSWSAYDAIGERDSNSLTRQILGFIPPHNECDVNDLFASCLDGIQPVDTNNIANVLTIIDTLKDLVKAKKNLAEKFANLANYLDPQQITSLIKGKLNVSSLPKEAANAWLQYRYVYLTTKSDIEVNKNLASELHNWKDEHGTFVTHASTKVGTSEYTMTVDVRAKAGTALSEFYRKLVSLGLDPSLTNLWDLTPWSFVVDWFVPVGDLLSNLDGSIHNASCFYDISRPCLSNKQVDFLETDWGRAKFTRYTRTVIPMPIYWHSAHETSTKTKVFRGFDGASLFIGSM